MTLGSDILAVMHTLEEGILYEALHTVGAESLIVQPTCMQSGAPACELEIHSSAR